MASSNRALDILAKEQKIISKANGGKQTGKPTPLINLIPTRQIEQCTFLSH